LTALAKITDANAAAPVAVVVVAHHAAATVPLAPRAASDSGFAKQALPAPNVASDSGFVDAAPGVLQADEILPPNN
jgi:hypothetical protein